jgi:hypothetical protein
VIDASEPGVLVAGQRLDCWGVVSFWVPVGLTIWLHKHIWSLVLGDTHASLGQVVSGLHHACYFCYFLVTLVCT